ncbi:hypothetical protein [Veillonella agrestimuris]|uniref:hypothetical protein n=1 Tax=Veillonella agrestimuris TaxID=2941340 RepID=UPI00203D9003|nr:hypothetical protein [Veillonella agrestimuris]
MKSNHIELIELFGKHQLEGIDVVNELMRFNVLDQLVSSNASSREWGITPEDLYALAETSTVEAFGPVPYDVDTFRQLYGPSFKVELFEFISDTGYLEGINSGEEWSNPVERSIEAHSKTGELVLYAYVEEYASKIDDILQAYPDKKVVLYTDSDVCYSMLTRLYPMAQIINHWPHRSYFDHIFVGTTGMFQSSEDIVEEVANGLHNLVPEGTAQLFLPATMVQNPVGLNNMALQFFLHQKRVESIYEWAPLGVYEIVYGKADVKKMRIGIREFVTGEWKEISYIPLPHGVFTELPVFSVLNYALSLRSIFLPGRQLDRALGQDGIYCKDSRLSPAAREELASTGNACFLAIVGPQGNKSVAISAIEPVSGVYWMFPDKEIAYMWYTYFSSTIGSTIINEISMLVKGEEAFGYMLSSVRRQVLSAEAEAHLINEVDTAQSSFDEAMRSAQEAWTANIDDAAKAVIPPAESIDLEDYSDFKK